MRDCVNSTANAKGKLVKYARLMTSSSGHVCLSAWCNAIKFLNKSDCARYGLYLKTSPNGLQRGGSSMRETSPGAAEGLSV